MAKSHTPGIRMPLLLTLAALLAALLALSALFPVTGDDWYRETVGQNLHTLSELAELLIEKYQTTNPRLLGNLLAYCAGSHAALRAVLRGGILFILILAAAKNINRLTPIPVLLPALMPSQKGTVQTPDTKGRKRGGCLRGGGLAGGDRCSG